MKAVVKFFLAKENDVTLTFYDLSGRRLQVAKDHFTPGLHEIEFTPEDLMTEDGIVLCQIATKEFVETQKIKLIQQP